MASPDSELPRLLQCPLPAHVARDALAGPLCLPGWPQNPQKGGFTPPPFSSPSRRQLGVERKERLWNQLEMCLKPGAVTLESRGLPEPQLPQLRRAVLSSG